MNTYRGRSLTEGTAIGKLRIKRRAGWAEAQKQGTPAEERERYETAKNEALAQLAELYQQACDKVGEEQAEIVLVQQGMLNDFDFNDSVAELINGGDSAEAAVAMTGRKLAAMFAESEADFIRERATDIHDMVERLVRILRGEADTMTADDEPFVLAANELTPSETLQLSQSRLVGVVTGGSSKLSHAAILARSLGLAAVDLRGMRLSELPDGAEVIVDGEQGLVITGPDAGTREYYQRKIVEQAAERSQTEALRGQPAVTKSGRRVVLAANIGNVADAELALKNDAEGVGLFRSEFLFLSRDSAPTEEEQFDAYRQVLEKMAGRQVIIRTIDIGADKKAGYLKLPAEENPALGCRGVRLCLKRPELFRTQLRALCRASVYGRLAIMVPMIISVNEVRAVKKLLAGVQAELKAEGIKTADNIEFGIMIETPAAAICSGELAKEVDFFSIGTNDLTQYTLAVDRQNASMEDFVDRHHPAVLKLIEQTIKNAKSAGIQVGICGELGADPKLTGKFIGFGVDELSVAPASILPLRERIRKLK